MRANPCEQPSLSAGAHRAERSGEAQKLSVRRNRMAGIEEAVCTWWSVCGKLVLWG
jgi:hypothetical protein